MFKSKKQEDLLEKLGEIQRRQERDQLAITASNGQIQKQQAFLEQLATQHKDLQAAFKEELKTLSAASKQLQAEAHNLKTAHIELDRNVADRFKEQLARQLQQLDLSMRIDTARFDELSRQLGEFKRELHEAKTVLAQFQALSKTIHEADFDLKEHAKTLEKADAEKLRLLKRIDDLETMLARMIRGEKPPARRRSHNR